MSGTTTAARYASVLEDVHLDGSVVARPAQCSASSRSVARMTARPAGMLPCLGEGAVGEERLLAARAYHSGGVGWRQPAVGYERARGLQVADEGGHVAHDPREGTAAALRGAGRC